MTQCYIVATNIISLLKQTLFRLISLYFFIYLFVTTVIKNIVFNKFNPNLLNVFVFQEEMVNIGTKVKIHYSSNNAVNKSSPPLKPQIVFLF